MQDVDEVQSIPGAGADPRVSIPAHVGLNNLSEILVPVLLEPEFHHGVEVARQARGGEESVWTGVDRAREPRLPLIRQPVVDLSYVAIGVIATQRKERVGAEGHPV